MYSLDSNGTWPQNIIKCFLFSKLDKKRRIRMKTQLKNCALCWTIWGEAELSKRDSKKYLQFPLPQFSDLKVNKKVYKAKKY